VVIAGRYDLEERLGSGGMGVVFKARDRTLHKAVALKFLRPELAGNAVMVERFKREVRTAHKVSHRFVCRVHDIGEVGGKPFFSMEYAAGGSLFDLLRHEGRMLGYRALEVAWQLSSGLEALHQEELVHRDLKPANVLFDRAGKVRITDLGLTLPAADLAAGVNLQGTIPYMAPEQLAGEPVTPKSDLYSLGLLLYEVFTGRPAFVGDSVGRISTQQRRGPRRPTSLHGDLDPRVERIILSCLELDPDRRPASAREIYDEIGRILDPDGGDRMQVAVVGGGAIGGGSHNGGTRNGGTRNGGTQGGGTRDGDARLLASAVTVSPFVSGRAVSGRSFLGRETELGTLFSRLDQGESTAVVGPRKSGKSSLLQHLDERETQLLYRPEMAGRLLFHWMDLHTVTSEFDPLAFWQEVLDRLEQEVDDPETCERIERIMASGYRQQHLRDLFDHLDRRGFRLALLLDEFEQLVFHPNFHSESRFFALLRSIATNTASLALVVASRLSVAELNRSGPAAEDGSPYFNYLIDVQLQPFDEPTIEELLGRAGDELSATDRRLIRRLAGRHPYLLQAAASTFLVERAADRRGAAETFYHRFAGYFDHLWKAEENRYRSVLLILGLAELAGRAAGRGLGADEITARDEVGYELPRLASQGLAERADGDHPHHRFAPEWGGERWCVGLEALLWWIWELVSAREEGPAAYRDWVAAEGYRPFLEPEEWQRLLARARAGSARSVGDLAAEFVNELVPETTDG
jgi:tRNA A-37 threonylcarbamoyl transferase component Bud32